MYIFVFVYVCINVHLLGKFTDSRRMSCDKNESLFKWNTEKCSISIPVFLLKAIVIHGGSMTEIHRSSMFVVSIAHTKFKLAYQRIWKLSISLCDKSGHETFVVEQLCN